MENYLTDAGNGYPDGIILWSDIVLGLGVREKVVDGEVHETIYRPFDPVPSDFEKSFSPKASVGAYLMLWVARICMFVPACWYVYTANFSTAVKIFLAFRLLLLLDAAADFVFVFVLLNLTKDGRSLKRFHGAEHKATKAYKKYYTYPTIDQIKACSRFSAKCSSRQKIITLIIRIIKVIMIVKFGTNTSFIRLICAVFAAGLILKALLLITKADMIFQWLVVGNPSDKEIKVAYYCVKSLKREEERYVAQSAFRYSSSSNPSFEKLFGDMFK